MFQSFIHCGIVIFVVSACILSEAILGTGWTKVASRSDMVCLYVASEVGLVLG